MKGFNTETENTCFYELLADFIVRAENTPPDVVSPELKKNMAGLCEYLRIARCEIVLYPAEGSVGSLGGKQSACLFDDGEYDKSRKLCKRKNAYGGSVNEYTVYQNAKDPGWTAEEKEFIGKFVSALFIVNSRSRLMGIVNKLADCDPEMDVYNLSFILKTINSLIADGRIGDYCACRFNMRSFSTVNNRIGRNGGTAVMKRFVGGLKDYLGRDGYVGRLGGDNFVVLFKKGRFDDVRKYLEGTAVKTDFRGLPEITVSAYAGYYMISDICMRGEEVIERIVVAQNMAKFVLNTPTVMYDESFKKINDDRKLIESLFFDAVDNGEFYVYYQPKINLKDCTLSGAEALCRWKRDGELIPPGKFIPTLEMSNNICVLDMYMLEHVCMDIRRWLDNGLPAVKVSVNFSRVHLGDENLSREITDVIDKYGVPHEYIEIELTETTTDVDFRELKRIVGELHSAGISTSVDDFGVGYSSLNLIRDLPWNVLKIDKSFLPEDTDENKNTKKVMLGYVVSMAHSLGLECIVEGVETLRQVRLLRECDCYRAQGFFFDKPLPVGTFEKRLMGEDNYKDAEALAEADLI